METKRFVIPLEVEAIPNLNDDDYPEDILAREMVGNLIQDAIIHVLRSRVNSLVKNDMEHVRYLDKKLAEYRKIEEGLSGLA